MWIKFNQNGRLTGYTQHGPAPRVGTTKFEIFAYFEDVNLDYYSVATIRLQKPDLDRTEYPTLFMFPTEKVFVRKDSDGDSTLFQDNQTYSGYIFDFSKFSYTGDDDMAIILDTPGKWQATITLVAGSAARNVTGLVEFYVEASVSSADNEETELSESDINGNISGEIATLLPRRNASYFRVSENFESDAIEGNLDGTIFKVGNIVYDKTNQCIYEIDSVTQNPDDETKVSAEYTLLVNFTGVINGVTLNTAQTITGIKTFAAPQYFTSGIFGDSNDGLELHNNGQEDTGISIQDDYIYIDAPNVNIEGQANITQLSGSDAFTIRDENGNTWRIIGDSAGSENDYTIKLPNKTNTGDTYSQLLVNNDEDQTAHFQDAIIHEFLIFEEDSDHEIMVKTYESPSHYVSHYIFDNVGNATVHVETKENVNAFKESIRLELVGSDTISNIKAKVIANEPFFFSYASSGFSCFWLSTLESMGSLGGIGGGLTLTNKLYFTSLLNGDVWLYDVDTYGENATISSVFGEHENCSLQNYDSTALRVYEIFDGDTTLTQLRTQVGGNNSSPFVVSYKDSSPTEMFSCQITNDGTLIFTDNKSKTYSINISTYQSQTTEDTFIEKENCNNFNFDTVPTNNSNNFVTSGGTYTELDKRVRKDFSVAGTDTLSTLYNAINGYMPAVVFIGTTTTHVFGWMSFLNNVGYSGKFYEIGTNSIIEFSNLSGSTSISTVFASSSSYRKYFTNTKQFQLNGANVEQNSFGKINFANIGRWFDVSDGTKTLAYLTTLVGGAGSAPFMLSFSYSGPTSRTIYVGQIRQDNLLLFIEESTAKVYYINASTYSSQTLSATFNSKTNCTASNFDTTPTNGSSKFITSGGVYSWVVNLLTNYQPLLTFDNEPRNLSSNPVTSDGIFHAISDVAEMAQGKTKNDVISYAVTGDYVKNSSFNSTDDDITIPLRTMSGSPAVWHNNVIRDVNGNDISLSSLKVGDNILVTEPNVPDRWVGSIEQGVLNNPGTITLYKLETKIDIDDTVTQNGTNPVSGSAVYTFVTNALGDQVTFSYVNGILFITPKTN